MKKAQTPYWLSAMAGLLAAAGCSVTEPRTEIRSTADIDAPISASDSCFATVALPSGDPATSLLLIEKCGPREIRVGERLEYTLIVTNLTLGTILQNVVVMDCMPPSFQVQATEPQGIEITSGADLSSLPDIRVEGIRPATTEGESVLVDHTVAPQAGPAKRVETEIGAENGEGGTSGAIGAQPGETREFRIGSLAPRERRTIRIIGTAIRPGAMTSRSTATYEVASFASIRTTATAPDLRLSITGPGDFIICGESTRTIRLTAMNGGTCAVDNVRIQLDIPSGISADQTTIDVGTLGVGQSRDISARIQARDPGKYAITATATGTSNQRTSATTGFTASRVTIDLKATGPVRDHVGLPLTYELVATNSSDVPAENIIIRSSAPIGTECIDATAGGAVAGEAATWRIDKLAPHESKTLVSRFRGTTQPGPMSIVATGEADCAPPVHTIVTTELEGVPAIRVEVIDAQDPNRAGEIQEYQITVTNQGSAEDTNIAVMADLPPQLLYISTDGPTQAAAEQNTLRFGRLPRLGAKQSATWKIRARCTDAGDLHCNVTVESAQHTRPVRVSEPTRVYE